MRYKLRFREKLMKKRIESRAYFWKRRVEKCPTFQRKAHEKED